MATKLGITLGLAALSVGGFAAGTPAHAAPAPSGIPHCLVGAWRTTDTTQDVLFQNHLVVVNGKGHDVDHIHANGIDRDDWSTSRALHGTVDDSPLREVVRGINRVQFDKGAKPGTLAVTELGWSDGNTATFTYQGKTSTQPNQQTGIGSAYFHCTATQLTWLNAHGDVLGHETRLSRKP